MASPLDRFQDALASAAAAKLGIDDADRPLLTNQIREAEAGRGDLALGCFAIAKKLERNPAEVAEEIAAALRDAHEWDTVEAVGPYVNLTYAPTALAEAVVAAARADDYGTGAEGHGKTVVIDFSSPNIAKPLAFHHIRSTVIGAAIGRLHAARGWNVEGINYLGDWGKQFGLLATGFARHGDPAKRADAKHLIEVYVKSNAEADVAKRRATIAAVDEAKKLIDALGPARTAAQSGDKKAKKSLKSLEKKIRSKLSLSADEPLENLEPKLEPLREAAEAAHTDLARAEALDKEARMFLKAMEDGEDAALAEWKEFRTTSIDGFQKVYDRMGVSFSSIEGESKYGDRLESALARVREKPGTKIDDGAEVVDMEPGKGEPPAILKTRDGTALYLTRDIAAAMDRYDRFDFARSLYVVAADQSLHFRMLFRTLKEMGFEWAERCQHIPFGRVHGMSTRRGNIVFLDEVLEEAVKNARERCEASEKIDKSNLDEIAEAVGIGAVVFGDLKNLRTSDYHFSWDSILDFSGHTGPYVQFSHARACSIIRKGGGVPAEADPKLLTLPEEQALIVALGKYPAAVLEACETFEPSRLTRTLIEVGQKTASYLTAGNADRSKRVLVEDDEATKAARLWLIDGVRHVLSHGLGLLGVRAPEAM